MVRNIADEREIEKRLIEILELIDQVPPILLRPEFIFVFDEIFIRSFVGWCCFMTLPRQLLSVASIIGPRLLNAVDKLASFYFSVQYAVI